MDLDALASVMNQADGKTITMGIEGKGKINLNDLQLKSIQSGDNVYDISITSGDKILQTLRENSICSYHIMGHNQLASGT